jgi:cytochrome c553
MKRMSALRLRRSLALLILLAHSVFATAANEGQDIYRSGVLPSGAPLVAAREGGGYVAGPIAACVNCHRRSGLGMKEGRTNIPPIAASYLFHPRAGSVEDTDSLHVPFVPGMQADRDPYTDETLARAIREGINAAGESLNLLMPRYELDDAAMAELIAYLKSLSPGAEPGVTESVLHFATIITPDADPLKRHGMLDVLEKFFEDKNHYTRAESPRLNSAFRLRFKVNRHWELHVWELSGASDTWEQQLQQKFAREPVFAVISGVGGKTWAPVHRFCETAAVPCLFPNVDLPVVAENDFDTLYLSKGVLLEANLIAHELKMLAPAAESRRVVQVYRREDVGEEAAEALAAALGDKRFTVTNRRLSGAAAPKALAAATSQLDADDTLVLWLRAEDIAALGPVPPGLLSVFLSGRMAGLENAPLPADWRRVAKMAYPVDLPDLRRVRLNFPMGWFGIRKVPIVAFETQADTYLACGIVSDTLNDMVDAFVPDYLVERVEEMLEHRIITGYYPRLALATGQRFASKGGYIVHFEAPTGTRVVADTDWITP